MADGVGFQKGARVAGEALPCSFSFIWGDVFEVGKKLLPVCFYLLCFSPLDGKTDLVGLDTAYVKDLPQDVEHLFLID